METVFTAKEFSIDYKTGDEFFIIPFGDVHRDTPSCDEERWKWFLHCSQQYPQDKTYYLGMGDFNDFASAKEQKIIRNSDLHDQTRDKFDEIAKKDNRRIAKEIDFMRGRLWGLLDGNHNWIFKDSTTGVQDLCERMQTEYMGWLSHITLKINIFNKTGTSRSAKTTSINMYIIACHGKAGGKLAGTTINQVEDLKRIFPVADIYLMGHDHQRGAWPTSVLIPGVNGASIKQKRQFLCRTGSFRKGYSDGVSGYEVGRLLRPSDLGAVVFSVKIHRDRKETDRLILDIKSIV
jgi:hypothetical protein